MAAAFFLFLAACFLSLINFSSISAHPEESNNNSNIKISCPKSFTCGSFGTLYFPFSNQSNSQCGLCTVFCDEDHPRLPVGMYLVSEPFFFGNITQISSEANGRSMIKLINTSFKADLDARNCSALRNLSLPYTPSISFSIPHNLTLFQCNRSSFAFSSPTDDLYFNYTVCDDHNYIYYYKYPDDNVSATANVFRGCPAIQLPLEGSEKIEPGDRDDPFKLLTATYFIELHVSEDCLKCHQRGGQCLNTNQKFHCTIKKEGTNVKLIILLVGGALVICFLVFIICVCKRWNYCLSYFPWRKISSDPSSKAEIEYSGVFFGVPLFKYDELEQATNNFHPSNELGDGGFGTVYHGILQDGREVAVKRLYEHNSKRVIQFLTEVEILTCLRHPNLVSLYGCTSRHCRELLLVYEYIPNGTVADHIHGDRAQDGLLTWPIRMSIAVETASALAYLHATEIIHRDVKTTNILLDNNFSVKVADFGLSRLLPTDVTHVSTAPQGTPGYVDPEYYQSYQLTDKSDVYSFGVVLIELISSMPAVDISRHRHEINLAGLALNRIQNRKFTELVDPSLGFESDSSVERMITSVAEVAFRCLQLEKEMRPSMNEILEALKEIQDYKDENNNGEQIDNPEPLNHILPHPSPEGDDAVLLKNGKVPPSPDSVTNVWISGSTASISSG
ncbi:LEAF RUST 10 DISEASE-RESISTANCE LOCUS RECEPTOR-LIKE PROTEIN KINASE-like 1.1 [Diospyros lotus]|uniref:LEAF RUST 10 DISEASE-RESISTANCE LOCUS RECEPTOR-LIKE PROTEIN KINASE-like 1.1 n=1 Tax=Diospyros lotus TaxID=55363 RepID=UPI0022517887|nr:LEAF RUST 10 DISEASE-RESISTANCE LOCUS RECEPTOR-LIKE PROTEIN KINASE-like 1.1 [Diospyros lotus]